MINLEAPQASVQTPVVATDETQSLQTTTQIVLEQWTLDLFDPIARKAGFADYTVSPPSTGCEVGDGFMGIIMRMVIKGRRNNRDDEMSVMLKMPPTSKARQLAFSTVKLFERESFVYGDVFPTFVDFQRSKGLNEDDSDGFFRFPIVHAIVCDAALDRYAIVMEDLRVAKYEMVDKFKELDLDHIRLVVAEMAKLHAVSFAMRDQLPEMHEPYSQLKCVFVGYFFQNQLKMMESFQSMLFGRAIAALRPDEVDLKRKMQWLSDNFIDQMEDCVRLGEERRSMSVVNHGDCWNNNMMYLYGDESGVPQKICFIDFQIARFATPVLDLAYFIFSSTTKAVRDQHIETIWDHYYTQLARTITRLGSDPDQLYSRATFDQERIRYGKFGVLLAPMLVHLITARASDLPDMDKMSVDIMASDEEGVFQHVRAMDAFNDRISDVMRDADAYGFLPF